MRISDWSSDVCSSDLNVKDGGELYGLETGFQTFFDFLPGLLSGLGAQANYTHVRQSGISNSNLVTQGALDGGGTGGFGAGLDVSGGRGVVMDSHRLAGISKHTFNLVGLYEKGPVAFRSEEHTSELQSLMRSSYDVFCLKKKK